EVVAVRAVEALRAAMIQYARHEVETQNEAGSGLPGAVTDFTRIAPLPEPREPTVAPPPSEPQRDQPSGPPAAPPPAARRIGAPPSRRRRRSRSATSRAARPCLPPRGPHGSGPSPSWSFPRGPDRVGSRPRSGGNRPGSASG